MSAPKFVPRASRSGLFPPKIELSSLVPGRLGQSSAHFGFARSWTRRPALSRLASSRSNFLTRNSILSNPSSLTGSSLRRIQSENNASSRRNFISRVYVQGCGAVRRSLHLAEFDLPLSPMVTQTRQGRSGNRIRESQEALVLLCGWARWLGERGVAAYSRQKRTQAIASALPPRSWHTHIAKSCGDDEQACSLRGLLNVLQLIA